MGLGGRVGVFAGLLGLAYLRFLLPELGGDGADLGKGTGRKHNTFGATLRDARGAVRHIETVTGASRRLKGRDFLLADGKRLARQESLVCLEVDCLEDAAGILSAGTSV